MKRIPWLLLRCAVLISCFMAGVKYEANRRASLIAPAFVHLDFQTPPPPRPVSLPVAAQARVEELRPDLKPADEDATVRRRGGLINARAERVVPFLAGQMQVAQPPAIFAQPNVPTFNAPDPDRLALPLKTAPLPIRTAPTAVQMPVAFPR